MSASETAGDTRTRLLEAALGHFGHAGYDGANIRAIAAAAGANIAAVNYHFGGKQALYIAVARHIVDQIRLKTWPQGMPAIAEADLARASRAQVKAILRSVVDTAGLTLLASPDAERWARFIVREQLEPTAAFDVLYEGVLGHIYALITRLVARLLDLDPQSPQARLEMFALIGQALVFRIGRAAVLRRMEWPAVGPREVEQITAQLHRAIDRLGETS
jgi:AcrR family transcriptional regulator